LNKEGENIRFNIEDAAVEHLEDEVQKNLLGLILWLRTNKLSPTWFRITLGTHSKTWKIGFKGKTISTINVVFDGLRAGSWNIGFSAYNHGEEIVLSDERFKAIAWKNINYCKNCARCRPGRSMKIGGKEFDRACGSPLVFYNPGVEEIECLKHILLTACDIIQSDKEKPPGPNLKQMALEQGKTKIEDYIPERLDGGINKASQEIIAFLHANKMKTRFAILNWWEVSYKGLICEVRLPYHHQKHMYSWAVGIYLNHMDTYEQEIISDELQNIVWDNLILCKACTYSCALGKDATVLGKIINGICVNCIPAVTWIYDPDDKVISGVKRLLELEIKARDENSKAIQN